MDIFVLISMLQEKVNPARQFSHSLVRELKLIVFRKELSLWVFLYKESAFYNSLNSITLTME